MVEFYCSRTDLSLTDFDPTLSFNRMSLENRWIPSFDMLESDKELMIMGDVPGVDRKVLRKISYVHSIL